jgi:glyceraldehyde-3-phosphate dehydrogenase (NADP+)
MTVDNFYAPIEGQNGAYKYFFEGQWIESSSGKTVKILNPSTNAPAFEVQGMYPQ